VTRSWYCSSDRLAYTCAGRILTQTSLGLIGVWKLDQNPSEVFT
jgi:hypothetical protein